MYCLKCQTKMKLNILRGVLVDFCENCQSFWLDKGELELLQKNKTRTQDEIDKEIKNHKLAELNFSYKNMCQRCGGTLKALIKDGIVLETCTICKGIFFDKGELDSLIEVKSFLKKILDLINFNLVKSV
jgi:Zn-finger nucleic acid-binding protein